MSRPPVARVMDCAKQAVIWQPFTEEHGPGEPALLIQRDAAGLLTVTQEGREVLIQPDVLPALIQQLKRLAAE